MLPTLVTPRFVYHTLDILAGPGLCVGVGLDPVLRSAARTGKGAAYCFVPLLRHLGPRHRLVKICVEIVCCWWRCVVKAVALAHDVNAVDFLLVPIRGACVRVAALLLRE